MRQEGTPEPPKKGAPQWMVTYSDVISLLVTFFVMLLTFSTADREKFDKVAGSLKGALGATMPEVSRLPVSGMMTERLLLAGRSSPSGSDFPPETELLLWAATNINLRLKNEKFGIALTMHLLSRGVMLRIPANAIFIGNSALLSPSGEDYLSKIALAVRALSNDIEVMSYAGRELKSSGEGSAWDLTHKRSARVAEFFQKRWGIAPQRLVVGGMGCSRPLGRNPSSRDDRLEITVLRKKKPADY